MQVKKAAKLTGIIVVAFAVLVTGLHFFIVYKSRQILNYIVLEASDGGYTLSSKKVRFHYNPLSITATRLHLYPVDSLDAKTYYSVTADSVFLEVAKLWPLLTGKNVNLGDVSIIRPVVKIVDKDTTTDSKKPLNLALSDIQDALVNSLSAFNVRQCNIEDAAIAYVKESKARIPFSVNHIYLYIDSLHAITQADSSSPSINFAAYIKLFIDRPDIQLPDTSASVYIQNLLLDSRRKVFSVNRFNLYENNGNGTIDSINLSNIHLRHFNWGRWLKNGVIEIDSLKAYDGATFFDFSDRELFKLKNRGRIQMNIDIPLIIHAVEINKIAYALRTGSSSGPVTIQLNGDSLAVNELAFSKDSTRPLQIGNLAFKVTRYSNNNENNINESSFEKLIIDHNDLELVNYSRDLNTKGLSGRSSIRIPSLKVLGFSLDDLFQYKLKADKLILEKPSLVFDIRKSERKRDADATVTNITESLRPSLDIRHLSIRDASIILVPKAADSGSVTIENLDTEIDARQLLESRSVMDIISSATALSTSGFRVTGPNIDLRVQRSALNPNKNGVYLERVTGNIGTQVNLDFHGVNILDKSERFDVTKLQHIQLDDVTVNGGKIIVQLNGKKNKSSVKTPAFSIGNLHTGPFQFELLKDDQQLTVTDIQLDGAEILINKGITTWDNIGLHTGALSFNSTGAEIKATALDINQPGSINIFNLNYFPAKYNGIERFFIPQTTIQTNQLSTSFDNLYASEIFVSKPLFSFANHQLNGSGKTPVSLPEFFVKELVVDQPSVMIDIKDTIQNKNIFADSGQIVLNNINSKSAGDLLSASNLTVNLFHPKLDIGVKSYVPDQFVLSAADLSFNTASWALRGRIDSASFYRVPLHITNPSDIYVTAASAGITNFNYASGSNLSLNELIKQNSWWGKADRVKHKTNQHDITIYHPFISANRSFFSFDSLTMLPLISRDSFWRSTPVEKDYNTLKLGYTALQNANLAGEGKDRSLAVQHLYSKNLDFLTEKDKTHGPDTVTYRPLLANSFQKIPLKIAIDTIEIKNGYVRHNVLPEKSKKEATIYFTNIDGFLYNVKNHSFTPLDSLQFRLRSQLMGQGDLLFGFRQSYYDSLQSFSMRIKMGTMDLAALNKLLVPMVSVKIDRGIADSVLLIADGNDNVAFGSMDLRYHNLSLSLLKKGQGKYFLSNVYNWLLNAVVRSKDNSRKESLYQERLHNKGIYNYWGKIAINGLLTNLGVKGDKKQLRRYKKAVGKSVLPKASD